MAARATSAQPRAGPRAAVHHHVGVPAAKPDAVVFDLDGVLIDSHDAITSSINHALVDLGLEARDEAELRRYIGPPELHAFAELTGQQADSAEVAHSVACYRAHYARVFLSRTAPIAGVPEALAVLAEELPLAIATSKPEAFAGPLLDALDLRRFFTVVAAPAPPHRGADKTAIVGRALAELGSSRAAMVGDRSFDVEAAHVHGLVAIGVLWGIGSREELRDARADALAEDPAELVRLLLS
jgi:phosphoglycolate phosphatase